jgi:hypothetical protein
MGFRDRVMEALGRPASLGKQLTGGMNVPDGYSTTVAADALVIPLTHGIVLKTTGNDAEALTLANGVTGQELTIILDVDGNGAGTLTPATSLHFATIVFADEGDWAHLMYVDDTFGWMIKGLGGKAGPPAFTTP